MFFEGSEKKLEVIMTPESPSLRRFGRSFWDAMAGFAGARILSSIANENCDAYLLSESSLFVWDSRFLVLTCGNTRLVDAALQFIESVGTEAIAFLSYQRKNEYFSHLQSSSFEQDIGLLRRQLAGGAYRVGHLDAHHHYLFTSQGPFQAREDDCTSELLMYRIRGQVAQYLNAPGQTREGVRSVLALDELFAGYVIDDFLFEPLGYSINGIKGKSYFTLHITPQESSSYVSFETNIDLARYPHRVFARLLKILEPASWDVIGFNSAVNNSVVNGGDFPGHLCVGSCSIALDQGYNVAFSHYQQLCHEVLIPELL
jgi:S-adenosylmethionine decarboxylase